MVRQEVSEEMKTDTVIMTDTDLPAPDFQEPDWSAMNLQDRGIPETEASRPDNVTEEASPADQEKQAEPEKKADTEYRPRFRSRFIANHKYFTICVYAVITFCVCLLIYKVTGNWQVTASRLGSILKMLVPFFIALMIAYFLNPLIRWIDSLLGRLCRERFVRARSIAALVLSYVLLVGLLALLITIVVPQVVTSIAELVIIAPEKVMEIQTLTDTFVANHPKLDMEAIQSFVDENLPNVLNLIQQGVTAFLPKLYSIGVSVVSWVVNIILSFVISCYLLVDKRRLKFLLKRILYIFVPERHADYLLKVVRKCSSIFSAYITGKAVDSLIIGILCYILMRILRLEYAALISVVVGVTNMIPYFGPFIGAIPGVLLLLLVNPIHALIFLIMILVLQQFDGNIIGPMILGDAIGLRPIWIIFGITVGGYLAGPIGMFLGVPVVAVCGYLLDELTRAILLKRGRSAKVEALLAEEQAFIEAQKEKVSMQERLFRLGRRILRNKLKKERP